MRTLTKAERRQAYIDYWRVLGVEVKYIPRSLRDDEPYWRSLDDDFEWDEK